MSFFDRIKRDFGEEEAKALMEALNESPSVSIRLNNKKLSNPDTVIEEWPGMKTDPVEWCPSGLYLSKRPDFIHDPLLHAGAYYVQEAASMVYESIIGNIMEGMEGGGTVRVLDLCAAPGGKTTTILNALKGNYAVVANEYDRQRAGILKENIDKWGDPRVIVTSSDAASLGRLGNCFDIIAVDAPCSGEGMMRREPVARSQWSEKLVESCAALQRDILKDILPALRPGGLLIYSTCTFNLTEDEENARWIEEECGLESIGPFRRFMPHRQRCEGLFVAVFRKPCDCEGSGHLNVALNPRNKNRQSLKIKGEFNFLKSKDIILEKIGNRIFGIPTDILSLYEWLKRERINILSAGTELAALKGDLAVPSSRQVLSLDFDRDALPLSELSREDAVAYLRRNAILLTDHTPGGYVVVCHKGFPIGLVKNIGNRANNLYPQEWRILS